MSTEFGVLLSNKINEIPTFAAKWKKLEIIMLGEISWFQRDRCQSFFFLFVEINICRVQKNVLFDVYSLNHTTYVAI